MISAPLEGPVQVPVVVLAAGLPRHVEVADGGVQVVKHRPVHPDGPVGVRPEEQGVSVPVWDQDVLRGHGLVPVHLPEHPVELLHDLLLAPGADCVVVAAQHSAEQYIGAPGIIFAPRLQILPDLELAAHVRVNIHDVMIVVPEGSNVIRELDKDLDVAGHLEHVDDL